MDIIESDLYLTKDGHLVYNHNAYIDETCNINGDLSLEEVVALCENEENRHYISDMTLAELQAYNFGYYFEDPNGERIYRDVVNPAEGKQGSTSNKFQEVRSDEANNSTVQTDRCRMGAASALFPERQIGDKGRPRREPRETLNGIFWIARSGAAWRDLPERYGPWQTVYERFREWSESGLIERIFHELGEDADLQDISIDSTYIKAHKASAGVERGGSQNP